MGTPSGPRQALPPAWWGGSWAWLGRCTGDMVECPPGPGSPRLRGPTWSPGGQLAQAGPHTPLWRTPHCQRRCLLPRQRLPGLTGVRDRGGDPLPARTWGGPSRD